MKWLLCEVFCSILAVEAIIMAVRRFIHNPGELLKQGQEIAKQPVDPKFIHRVIMVNLVLSGMKVKDLSQCGGNR